MKKYFYLIAVAFLSLLTFNACSSDSPEEELPPKEEPEKPDTPVDPDNPSTSDNVVLAENTVLLTDSIDKYVTDPVTGTTLNLDASIDEAELPEVGQVLLYGNVSEKFPLGFLGKVKDVVKSSSGYEVITEPVSLEEAFDKLYINETTTLTFDDNDTLSRGGTIQVGSGPWLPGDGYVGWQYSWGVDFSKELDKEWNTYSQTSGSLSGTYTGGFAVGFKLSCNIDIDKKVKKDPYINITVGARTSFGSTFKVSGSLKQTFAKKIIEIPINPCLMPQKAAIQIVLNPAFILSAFMEFEGDMDLELKHNVDKKWELSYIYEHGQSSLVDRKGDSNDKDPVTQSFSLEGSVGAGLSGELGMKLFNNENVTCKFEILARPTIEANMSLDNEENVYERLKDSKVTFTLCKISASAKAEISHFLNKMDAEASVQIPDLVLGKKEYYLFPEFTEKNALWKGDNQLLAEYDVKRDLLFPAQLGMRLMDKDKRTLKDDVSLVEYHYGKEESPTLLSATFSNVNSRKDYYVCPIVELPLFGKVAASPVTKIGAKQDTCHIDFTIEYPKYSDSYRMNGRDEVSCEAALYPIYENENQRKDIVGAEAILYKDGKEVTRSSYQWLGRNIISKLFKREELVIDYENYIARPKDGRWQVSMAFKKLDEHGDTVTCVTDVIKDVDLKYDTKPVMIIYRCDIDGCYPHSMESEHHFGIDASYFVRGIFWCNIDVSSNPDGVVDGEVYWSADDFSLGRSWGVSYTNDNIPNRLVMKYIDYNGRLIESNSFPIQTDANGCVIDSYYEDTSGLAQYNSRWSFD